MRTAVRIAIDKQTGARIVYEIKQSWGKSYFSFDRETWDASKLKAFKTAKAAGKLRMAEAVRP